MGQQIVLAVLALTLLLGAALFVVQRADRRRRTIQDRLQQFAAATAATREAPAPPLRRQTPRRRLRGQLPLPMLWRHLGAEFAAAGNRVGVPHLAIAALVTGTLVVVFLIGLLGLGPIFAVIVAAVAGIAAAIGLLRFAQNRYRNRFLDVFPDALDLLARAVRAGLPVFDAMEVAAHEVREPVGHEFRRTLDEMRIGVEIEDALQRAADRIRVPDFRFYVVALALQRRTGGSLAETLGNLSNIIRRRRELRLKARALSAESKASAWVLAILPFVVAGALALIAHSLMQVLWNDPRGRFMVGIALLSVFCGIGVMAWIIKRSLR